MSKGWGRGRKKTERKKAGRRRSKKTEEGDNYLMWGRRRHGLTNNFTLAVYMQFLVAADRESRNHERQPGLCHYRTCGNAWKLHTEFVTINSARGRGVGL